MSNAALLKKVRSRAPKLAKGKTFIQVGDVERTNGFKAPESFESLV